MKTSYLTILAFHIRDLREEKGITQLDIANKLGMTSAGWGKIENGKSALSVENMLKFCKVVDIDPCVLLNISTESARVLIEKGWVVSYSPVERDNLIDGKNIYTKLHTMNNIMRKFVGEHLEKILTKEYKDSITKCSTIYMVIVNKLGVNII
ncbi:TPA: helix-turn-helix transcriptional regulator [Escherichia coli]|uniref:Helix-turn-helix transcriptional regulator n=3 Tax=Enterobacteriaceae TaxID=543 RepID=A0A7W3ANC9_9ESCH|nr:helix-turn-helix transcriptional regulator [Escherichia coli]MBA7900576.1 helix-turn-helix transcriptional regulator [Escherichia marmotae]EGS5135139.1 helix-turn-helix transcriptional regulator [Escherichia coli]EGS5162867.1 helix-turn-helix transcriptional regulator [Escherichia coli]EGS5176274.1 helix-turn-helix transcriptional regulator [Escherichia coli]EII2923489.1 helix-turn-helix transcriptional regulator [Escherichia coli]